MKIVRYLICGVFALHCGLVKAQQNLPEDAVGLNAVVCEILGILEIGTLKNNKNRGPELLQYEELLQKMSDAYFKIKSNEFEAGRLTNDRAGDIAVIVGGKYLSEDPSQKNQVQNLIKECFEWGIKNGFIR